MKQGIDRYVQDMLQVYRLLWGYLYHTAETKDERFFELTDLLTEAVGEAVVWALIEDLPKCKPTKADALSTSLDILEKIKMPGDSGWAGAGVTMHRLKEAIEDIFEGVEDEEEIERWVETDKGYEKR